MLRINITLIIGILFSQFVMAQISTDGGPCGEGPVVELTTNGTGSQSSTDGTGNASKAIDGNIVGNWSTQKVSRTEIEHNPWWEVDLGDVYALQDVQVYYPADVYPNGLSNYYILISRWSFETTSLSQELASDKVASIHVNTVLPTGQAIPLSFQSGRYLRIQLAEEGDLSFVEIHIPGGSTEICGNGIDDDCDGKTDCEDTDCRPNIQNVDILTNRPSCNICNDGIISINASGENLVYSIDGGQTNQEESDFGGLQGGVYQIQVTNQETGCMVTEEVLFQGPIGTPNDCCMNGGFELGDFTGWTGGIGSVDAGVIQIDNMDIDDSHHILVSDGYVDPIVPEIPVFENGGGTYVAKLGNSDTGNGADRLTYCTEITDCNSTFTFNFLFVLQNPSHSPITWEPYFQYRYYLEDGGGVIGGPILFTTEDENSDYSYSVPDPAVEAGNQAGGTILYTHWLCEAIDLSDYIGQNVCVEFAVADCSEGGHYGYAYLDGLCTSIEDIAPSLNLNVNMNFCGTEDIILDASESFGFNEYTWEVCKLTDSGDETECFTIENIISETIDEFNVNQSYGSAGGIMECDATYRVKLTLKNNCTDPVTEFYDFRFHCNGEILLSYENVLNCTDEQADIMIEGSASCDNCEIVDIQWFIVGVDGLEDIPAGYMDDPTIQNPTLTGSINVNTWDNRYMVIVTNDLGCTASKIIKVDGITVHDIEVLTEEDHCNISMIGSLQIEGNISQDDISAEFINVTTGVVYPGVFVSTTFVSFIPPTFKWTFARSFDKNEIDEGIYTVRINLNTSGNSTCEEYEAELGYFESTDLFYGDMQFWIPNAFNPSNPNANNIYRVRSPDGSECGYEELDQDYCSNATSITMKIYSRWGEEVFNETIEAEVDEPLTSTDLFWDGTFGGELLDSDVFGVVISFANCDLIWSDDGCSGWSEDSGWEDCTGCCVLTEDNLVDGLYLANGDCPCWKGNVTLLQ